MQRDVSSQPRDVTDAIRLFLSKMKKNDNRCETRLKGTDGVYNKSTGPIMKKTTTAVVLAGASIPMTPKKLQSLTKQELVDMCRERNMNCYGTKFDMVQRLLSSEKKGILQEIKHSIPAICLHPHESLAGVYVHRDSGLVFDPCERKVVGRRRDTDGAVIGLTYKDIQMCLRYKFRYVLPSDLADRSFHVSTEKSSRTTEKGGEPSTVDGGDERLLQRLLEIENGGGQSTTTTTEMDDDDVEEEESADDHA